MDCDELRRQVEQGETVRTEFKSKLMVLTQDQQDLAASLAAIANRFGGNLLLGIDDKTKKIEPGGIENLDAVAQRIAHLARDLCSPPPDLRHELVRCPEGDVIAFHVRRRRGMPIAVVRRKGGEISHRTYYVRNNQGRQLVTDTELEHMFRNPDFPILKKSFPFAYAYDRRSFGEVYTPEFPSRTLQDMVFIAGLPRIVASDTPKPDAVTVAMAELFPYATLSSLARNFSAGWGWEVQVAGFGMTAKSTNEPTAVVGPDDLPRPPTSSLLGKGLKDFDGFAKTVLLFFQGLQLPPDSKLRIDFPGIEGAKSMLHIESPGAYRIDITYRGGSWSVGLPPGHPLDTTEGPRILKTDDPHATVYADVDMELELFFGDPLGRPHADYYQWGERLFRIIEAEFSWFKYVDRLPDPFLCRIERKVGRILNRLDESSHAQEQVR